MKTFVLFFALTGLVSAQGFFEDPIEPVRTYENGLNIAKAEKRPLLVFVSQKVCAACKPAYKLLDELRQDNKLGRCVIATVDSTTAEGKALMVGKKLTPQIVLLDLRRVNDNGSVDRYGIETVDEPLLLKLVDRVKARLR